MILRDLIPLDEVDYKVEDKKSLDFVAKQDIDFFLNTLTKKQRYVLEKLLEGWKQYEIADIMGVSEPAMTKHKKLIGKKIKRFLEYNVVKKKEK